MKIIPRKITSSILKRLKYRNIIAVTGARQTGKTTLCSRILPQYVNKRFEYILFDDPEERIRFKEQGISILQNLKAEIIVFDEVQKVPEVFEYIKYISEKNREKKFILTGSSHLLLLTNIKESLAGRISIFYLYSFSISELAECKNNILNDIIFDQDINSIFKKFLNLSGDLKRELIFISENLLTFGGFPKVWEISDENEKYLWLKDYKTTFIEKDLRDIGGYVNIENFIIIQKLLAIRTGQLLNLSEISKEAGVSVNTVKNYINILKIGFQCHTLQPYFFNIKKRIIKSPKIYFTDNGIIDSILGKAHISEGAEFENFIFSELLKWKESIDEDIELYFLRTGAGFEIDFIIKYGNFLCPVEVKSGINVENKSIRNIKKFLNEFSNQAKFGIIIYKGNEIKKLDKNIIALPYWFVFT